MATPKKKRAAVRTARKLNKSNRRMYKSIDKANRIDKDARNYADDRVDLKRARALKRRDVAAAKGKKKKASKIYEKSISKGKRVYKRATKKAGRMSKSR